MVCLAKSIDQNGETEFRGVPLRHDNCVRMINHFFAFEIKILSRTEISFVVLQRMDPQLKVVPVGLQVWVSKKFMEYMIKKMIKYSKSFKGTPYEEQEKMPDRKAYYEWLDRILEDHYRINNL